MYETIKLEIDGAIARITMDRPAALNALNARVFEELPRALEAAENNAGARVVVITGAGDKAFVAGADIKEFESLDGTAAAQRSRRGMHVYDRIRHSPLPIIASINGYALGGGMLLAMACDIRIAADTATFGYPEIRLGIFPGTGGTILIDRLIGPGAARAICLLGDHFSAQRAYELNLVNQIVPKAELAAATRKAADTLASYSPVAVRELKTALNASIERDFESAREIEIEAYGRCFASEDRREGVRAFVEKRPPNFVGK